MSDTKSAVRGVVTEKGLMARFSGMGRGIAGDSSGNRIDKQFAPLDIGTGGKGNGAWKGTLDRGDDDVMSGSELSRGGLRARENDKVARGGPLRSGDPDVGVSGF